MPLSRRCGKLARSENIGRLIHEGKKPSQAAAIAYSVQREEGCSVPRKVFKGRARGSLALDKHDLKVLKTAAMNRHGLVWIVVEARGYQDVPQHAPLRSAEKLVREGVLARDDQTPIASFERDGQEKNFVVITYTITAHGTLAYRYLKSNTKETS